MNKNKITMVKKKIGWRSGLFIFGLFFSLSFQNQAFAATGITSSGNWAQTIAEANLQGGAGSGTDLTATYTSATNASVINITSSTGSWTVSIKRSGATGWHANFNLYAQRTSAGTGSGTISGGTTYQLITTTSTSFFTGTLTRSGMNIQYQLTGVSLTVAPAAYTQTLTFTVAGS